MIKKKKYVKKYIKLMRKTYHARRDRIGYVDMLSRDFTNAQRVGNAMVRRIFIQLFLNVR